ncbi:hypothetical protein DFQ12_0875 [Sphingobacterium detergens]|uniref:Uncharacterized protein n=1 Tax=Sphingobacterium detergens TaxID=1145106 RepID=A0A420BH40_SPHD1|nr:hypothetical protein DFQ12_0875 [Sphingobacterium detergens]
MDGLDDICISELAYQILGNRKITIRKNNAGFRIVGGERLEFID